MYSLYYYIYNVFTIALSFFHEWQIITKEALAELKIDETVESVQMGFFKNKCKIDLTWKNGHLNLGNGWNDFAKVADLREGDISVIQATEERNIFEAAIFHMKEISKWIS